MSKLRKLGNITNDLEILLLEMSVSHQMQMGEILALVQCYLQIHVPECIEKYVDGTEPVYYYGHRDHLYKNK